MVRELQSGMYIVKRKRFNVKRTFLFRYFTNKALIILLVALVLIVSMLFAAQAFAAESEPSKVKTIASVRIQPGDSLWTIAEQYYSRECGNMQEYISEIKQSNGLHNDTIHAGAYIIVPYYSDITHVK